MAEEESEHANKFMKYQNKRGGTIVLLDIKVQLLIEFFFEYEMMMIISRNQLNKVGVHHLKPMKQLYNWKKMFIKHYLNFMHLLVNTSKTIY
jgi:hypothetical protein